MRKNYSPEYFYKSLVNSLRGNFSKLHQFLKVGEKVTLMTKVTPGFLKEYEVQHFCLLDSTVEGRRPMWMSQAIIEHHFSYVLIGPELFLFAL